MKNKWWVLAVVFLIIAIVLCCYFFFNKSNNNLYIADRTSTNNRNNIADKSSNNASNTENNNVNQNTNVENTNVNEHNTNINNNLNNLENNTNNTLPSQEEVISAFSTKVYSKDANRQNNIKLACSELNGTIVPNGSTFSFCKTVGQSTPQKGYTEADIFDEDGNKKKGIGGGKCQISTTLYNAVLNVPNLIVTERHEHSNKVPYIQDGKDAAVNYGTYDLKFENRTGFDIKINADSTSDAVNISIYKVF